MWLAETKGEIRPNTALKSEAARLWREVFAASGQTIAVVSVPATAVREATEHDVLSVRSMRCV